MSYVLSCVSICIYGTQTLRRAKHPQARPSRAGENHDGYTTHRTHPRARLARKTESRRHQTRRKADHRGLERKLDKKVSELENNP